MKTPIDGPTRWLYRGVWAWLVKWFRVPDTKPTLPVHEGEVCESFQPARGYLTLLRFHFWVSTLASAGPMLVGTAVVSALLPPLGFVLAPFMVLLVLVPTVAAYVALHLRYDTTWYVMTPRSLRIRRGIWIIHETTITFDNVQNITVAQGPIERLIGIGNVRVETAGGGSGKRKEEEGGMAFAHQGLIAGVADPSRVRDQILGHLRRAHTAGLGDEHVEHAKSKARTHSPAQLAVLREIRDLAVRLADNQGDAPDHGHEDG